MATSKGFTLIELLLSISIAASILLLVSLFLATLLQSRIKNQTVLEVEQQGIEAMHLITQTVRNAKRINSPLQGTNASSLSLELAKGVKNPTVFDLANGVIWVREGTLPPIALTSPRLITLTLSFSNLSRRNTPGTVRIQFTLTHRNPEGRNEYNYSKTFYDSASIR